MASSPLARRAAVALSLLVAPRSTFAVAVSGGSDSTALLVFAAEFARAQGSTFQAVTVDHGLRPEAKQEARQVGKLSAQLGVMHATLRWRRDGAGDVGQEEARLARHRLIAAWAG